MVTAYLMVNCTDDGKLVMAFFTATDNLFYRIIDSAIQEFSRVCDGHIAIRKLIRLIRCGRARQPCHGHSGN